MLQVIESAKSGIARGVVVLVVVLPLLTFGHERVLAEEGTQAQPMIGDAAPGFELKTVAGDTLSLADLGGRYLVIHFGASW